MPSPRYFSFSLVRAVPYVVILTLGLSAYTLLTQGDEKPIKIENSDRDVMAFNADSTVRDTGGVTQGLPANEASGGGNNSGNSDSGANTTSGSAVSPPAGSANNAFRSDSESPQSFARNFSVPQESTNNNEVTSDSRDDAGAESSQGTVPSSASDSFMGGGSGGAGMGGGLARPLASRNSGGESGGSVATTEGEPGEAPSLSDSDGTATDLAGAITLPLSGATHLDSNSFISGGQSLPLPGDGMLPSSKEVITTRAAVADVPDNMSTLALFLLAFGVLVMRRHRG